MQPSDTPISALPPKETARSPRPKTPLTRALDFVGGVWFGVAILALLFLYMSIGSAGYVIRQSRLFEMTEFEWFHWWPFDLLVALLCLSIALVTIRRIRLTITSAGVWMVHIGVVVLCVGSVIYFSAKVEGDTPVFRRRVVIESAAHPPVQLVALPGAHAVVGEGPDQRVYEVVETRPDWPILTGADEGKKTYSVSVAVTRADAQSPPSTDADQEPAAPIAEFTRQLLDGFPAYTEDVIPGQGRAIKTIGRKLVDESLSMRLETEPQTHFYLANSWALYTRTIGPDSKATPWVGRTIPNLPRYNDYIASRDEVWPTMDDAPLRIDPIDIRIAPDPANPSAAPEAHVTGYLRYAAMQPRYVQGAPDSRVNPVVRGRLEAGPGAGSAAASPAQSRPFTLAAFESRRSASEDGTLAFVWADSPDELARIGDAAPGVITIRFPNTDAPAATIPATAPIPGSPEPPFTDIGPPGAGYAIRIREIVDNLAMGDGRTLNLAIAEVRTPTGVFTRWIAEDPAATRDFVDTAGGAHDLRAPDAAIETVYTPARRAAPVTIVVGPGVGDQSAIKCVLAIPGMERSELDVRVGERIALGPQAALIVESYWPRAAEIAKPVIVPVNQRDRDAGVNYAMIKVEVPSIGGQTLARWLPFHQYVFDDASYVYGGRFRFEPARIELGDGRAIEILFSRERRPLPAPVRLDDFRLVAHVGGFTGEVASIRDWESVIRFDDPRAAQSGAPAAEPLIVRTNGPVGFRGFRFFQAMWDPPMPEAGSGGLNFTGLGIGNRKGVGIQLAGSIIATIGMLYAFYVKPVIKRRRAEAALAKAAAAQHPNSAAWRPAPPPRPLQPEPAIASAAESNP